MKSVISNVAVVVVDCGLSKKLLLVGIRFVSWSWSWAWQLDRLMRLTYPSGIF